MKKSLLISLLLSIGIFSQSPVNKISDRLDQELKRNAGNTQIMAWVFFTDKGKDLQKFSLNPESVVSKRSLERRKKYIKGADVLDFTDLPVNRDYVNKIEDEGAKIRHIIKWLNGVSIVATKSTIEKIQKLPFVASLDVVEKANSIRKIESDNSPIIEKQQPEGLYVIDYGQSFTQLNQINVPAVHNLGLNGQGITIAVLDAGFNRLSHESFASMNIIAAYDFVNHNPGVGDSTDMGSGSHGTQTLSTIGGFKSGQLVGPAFGASYILAKTENTESETPVEEDNWLAAIEWADSIGCDVSSTSLGYIDFDPPYTSYTWQNMDGNFCRITRSADLAVKKGIVVVNSAGNEGYNSSHNTLGAPSDGDSVIAVGAVTSSGTISSFSSVGNTVDGRIKPDVCAMGSSVRVASPASNTGYTYSSGTSFSCPLAAGVAALILQARPHLSPIQVREAMRMTASRANTPDRQYGWGILNTLNAINYFPVPVELVSFQIKNINTSFFLIWETATETNNRGFGIEYSPENSVWTEIGFIPGKGNSAEVTEYRFPVPESITSGFFRLKQIDFDGTISYSNVLSFENFLTPIFNLKDNYPNPFNPSTTIAFELQSESAVSLRVYNSLGEEVAVLVNGVLQAGSYEFLFNASDLSAGSYFYRLQAGSNSITKKMLLLP